MQRTVLRRVSLEPWLFTYQYSKFPSEKTTNGNRKDMARIPQSSISLSTGKDGRKRESVKSSRNINYTQDKYTAIRHVHTIKIFVSCNYHKFRWDTERYTMNFLILLKLADEWLAQECYMILKVEGESDFYADYDGRVLIRQIISLRYDVYRLSGLFLTKVLHFNNQPGLVLLFAPGFTELYKVLYGRQWTLFILNSQLINV